MRKTRLLSIVAMLLFTIGAWADKTVTWNESAIGSIRVEPWDEAKNNSIDGITVTQNGEAHFFDRRIEMRGESGDALYFESSIGDIKKIEIISEGGWVEECEGWSGDLDWNTDKYKATWTGTPTNRVTLSGNRANFDQISSIVFTIHAIDYTVTPFLGLYDGNAHGISISAQSGATVKYGTAANNCNLNASPTYTEVGKHVVYYQVSLSGYPTATGSSAVDIWPVGTALSETFDYCGSNLPTGWTTETVGWENYSWVIGAGDKERNHNSAHSGSQNVLYSYYNDNNTCKLTSPQFTVANGYNAARVNFWMMNSKYAKDIDELKVYYRTEANGTLTLVGDITSNHESWTRFSYLLPANACQVVFEFVGHRGYSVGIDDVQIVGTNAYSITYELNDGTVATANPTIYDTLSDDITLVNPTREGYDFLGWTGSNGDTPQTTVTITTGSTGNKTYTANWQAIAPPNPTASWVGKSYVYANGTWYYAGENLNWDGQGGAFNYANLGTITALSLGGQSQVWAEGSADWNDATLTMTMGYKIDGGTDQSLDLTWYKFADNNNYFQSGGGTWAPADIDISGLTPGEHSVEVWFTRDGQYDSNDSRNYKATFTIPAPTVDIAANEGETGEYWSTFYSPYANYQAAAGTQVFKVTLEGTTIALNEVGDGIINKGQGVLLKSTTGSYELTPCDGASTVDYSDNSLEGTAVSITNPGENNYYVLGKGSNGVGFYKLDATGTIAANKAYLTYSGSLAREFFGFGEATSISLTPSVTDGNATVFDLQGRRVQNPQRGVYIVNGRKVVIK